MGKKLIELTHLKSGFEATKKLIYDITKSVIEAIEELNEKMNKVKDKETGITYTISMENGSFFLDDGKDEK